MPSDGSVTVRDMRLHYLEWGDSAAPPIVLLHAGSATAHTWDAVAPVLAETHRVIAFDARDHGLSDGSTTPNDPMTHVNDVAGAVDALDLDRFGLLGGSMGGRTALAFTALHPDRVNRLVLEDIGPGLDADGQEFVRMVAANRRPGFASRAEVVEWLRVIRPYTPADWLEGQVDAVSCVLDDGSLANNARQHLVPQPAERQDPLDHWQLWTEIRCPILVIRGDESPIIGDSILERMQAMRPRMQSVTIRQSGHYPHEDNLADYLAAVVPFFAAR